MYPVFYYKLYLNYGNTSSRKYYYNKFNFRAMNFRTIEPLERIN